VKEKRETILNLKLLLTIAYISLFATEAAQPILASLAANGGRNDRQAQNMV